MFPTTSGSNVAVTRNQVQHHALGLSSLQKHESQDKSLFSASFPGSHIATAAEAQTKAGSQEQTEKQEYSNSYLWYLYRKVEGRGRNLPSESPVSKKSGKKSLRQRKSSNDFFIWDKGRAVRRWRNFFEPLYTKVTSSQNLSQLLINLSM